VPDIVRVAPTPLYNTFHEVWRFTRILAQATA
jgi:kynureninase